MENSVGISKQFAKQDAWGALKKFTNARIALGRTGNAIPLAGHLQFMADHALARDAVYATLDVEKLSEELSVFNMPVTHLQSNVANRVEYLQRPDLGRQLNIDSKKKLTAGNDHDIAIIITDGLSARAVQQHAQPVLKELLQLCGNNNFKIAPLCIVEQGRVAIGDETGMLLNAKLSLILIGERPGLSSPNSMGIYITYKPTIGLTDESRNCISNIHPNGGLTYANAAVQTYALIQSALASKVTGVNLKVSQLLNS